MGIWENLFGKNKAIKPVKSPFLPPKEEPVDIEFAKTNEGEVFVLQARPITTLKNL